MKNRHHSIRVLFPVALTVLAMLAGPAPLHAAAPAKPPATATAPQSFPTPEAAADALIAALQSQDPAALRTLLGPGSEDLISSGDAYADAEARKDFIAAYQKRHSLHTDAPDRRTLVVGENDFPLPLPIVQAGGAWHFDTVTGAQQVIDRRIGANEIAAIRTALSFVDAEKIYFQMTQAEGHGEYAQFMVSKPGAHDGLYWPAEEGQPESPLAPLVAQALEDGYPGEIVQGRQMPYHGYYFRILKAQGPNAQSGALDYVDHGHMTKGFALIAYPARYGASGVMTFMVNQDGVVYQKDLGPSTASIAAATTRFDPGLSWARVDIVD